MPSKKSPGGFPQRSKVQPRRSPKGAAQRGAATLVLAVVLCFCLTLILIYAAKAATTAQRMAGNDAQARIALGAAQGGLESALIALTGIRIESVSFDADGWTGFAGPSRVLEGGASYSTRISNRGLMPGDIRVLEIESIAVAPDGSGMRVVRQLAARQPWLAHPPPSPLVVRGHADFADLELINQWGSLAAWTGGDFSAGFAAIDVADEPRCDRGVCANDSRLAGITADGFLETFFGRDPQLLALSAAKRTCEICAFAPPDEPNPVYWLDSPVGTVSLSGTLGSEENPLMIVVDGDLILGGDTVIYGALYIRGNWVRGSGGLSLLGSLVVSGDAAPGSTVRLQYEPTRLEPFLTAGPYVRIAGSWSDF
jgi:hypothetical protein